jgi:hypothetical protein
LTPSLIYAGPSISPTSITFSPVTLGPATAIAVPTITVTNNGRQSISIRQVTSSSPIFVASGPALPLTLSGHSSATFFHRHGLFQHRISSITVPISFAADQSTSFNVFFVPATGRSLSGTVTVASNASNSPTAIKLSGSGVSATAPSFSLSWLPSSSAYTGFNIYRGAASGGPYTKIGTSSTAVFTDNGVAGGQTYYYVVTEIGSSGAESTFSNQAPAVVP